MYILLSVLGGFALLVFGGDLLVRGAVRVASRLGVSPLVIGLTLVGFGTSTPELVTSVQAALEGSPGIAYGNIVGSNIANILLILGISAMMTPIVVTSAALKRDSAIMLGVAVVFAVLAATVPIGRVIGVAFLGALAAYLYLTIRHERSAAAHGAVWEKSAAAQVADPGVMAPAAPGQPLWISLALALSGLLLVVLGGYLLVDGAVGLARHVGVSETVIGLTVVAVGTSLPELVTSVMAALRRESDVAFGNIIGSNIYNVIGIGGTTALIAPTDVPAEIVAFDNFVMLGASALLILFAWTGMRIVRWEGGVLGAGYVAYIWWLWP